VLEMHWRMGPIGNCAQGFIVDARSKVQLGCQSSRNLTQTLPGVNGDVTK
jgi:hypothetical protein